MLHFEYELSFYNEKYAELSKEFGDVFRFWLASKPRAAEAPEVDVRADRPLGGILPYRKKSDSAQNSKIKIQKHDIHNLHRCGLFR